MHEKAKKILVWLPSPIGDAILCTAALRSIRVFFSTDEIYFIARPAVRKVLSGSGFNDLWIEQESGNPFAIGKKLQAYGFSDAILFKNSFASALSVFWAGIPGRVGYSREGRGVFLTEKLYPHKKVGGKYRPGSIVDYYLAIAYWLGCNIDDRRLELCVETKDLEGLKSKLPELGKSKGPLVVLVPGGAFGPSKLWRAERYSAVADWFVENYKAKVVVSVSPDEREQRIAGRICDLSKYNLINLGNKAISLGELKALIGEADLVICNDTGPRHIAIALGGKVVTLFGPNNPNWTDTGYEDEIKIIGEAVCAPCDKAVCKKSEHFCMDSISPEQVCEAAKELLEGKRQSLAAYKKQRFEDISRGFYVDADYGEAFGQADLADIDGVFRFSGGRNLTKANLAIYRARIEFKMSLPDGSDVKFFLKRYQDAPVFVQLKTWLSHRRRKSLGSCDFEPSKELLKAGVKTAKVVCFGEEWSGFFEKRSFVITEELRDAQSLEKKLPEYFYGDGTSGNISLRRDFIARLGKFVRKFHNSGFRHRDLYFSHIFCDKDGEFYVIDLARAFKPVLFSERFMVKDIGQLFYSAPGRHFSATDRLRFYKSYAGKKKLDLADKVFIRKVVAKARRIAGHDKKHGRAIPFLSK